MSRLEELIQQYCPDGVEYKKLGEICNLSRGKVYSKSYIEENAGEYPVYSSQTANNGELGRISTYDYDGEYLTWTTDGAYAGTIFYRKGKFSITNVCGLISIKGDNLHIKFLFYWLCIKAPDYVYRGMGNPKLMSNQMEPIKVPIPPLPVQEEIVRNLDAFTELQAELQAELQKRLQQYNYYRDNLLSFEGRTDVEWKKLDEICYTTSNIKWKNTSEYYEYIDLTSVDIATHAIISTTKINSDTAPSRAQQIVKQGDVIFATTRPTQMRVCMIPSKYDGEICSTGYCVLRPDNTKVLSSFLFFILSIEDFKRYLEQNQTIGNYPAISNKLLKEYVIPVPSLAEQQRIVDILDRFNTLTTDIIAGLPAEIEARRKQYEYYRDQLLTFKKKA